MSGKSRFGPDNPMWTGQAASYNAVHLRLRRTHGQASDHLCACGRQAQNWSYDHADPDERTSSFGPYSTDLDHYRPLCISCHRKLDQPPDFRPPMTKLTPRDVREIRGQWATGEWTQRQLADEFGVSLGNVNRIVLGQIWADVGGPRIRTRRRRA